MFVYVFWFLIKKKVYFKNFRIKCKYKYNKYYEWILDFISIINEYHEWHSKLLDNYDDKTSIWNSNKFLHKHFLKEKNKNFFREKKLLTKLKRWVSNYKKKIYGLIYKKIISFFSSYLFCFYKFLWKVLSLWNSTGEEFLQLCIQNYMKDLMPWKFYWRWDATTIIIITSHVILNFSPFIQEFNTHAP